MLSLSQEAVLPDVELLWSPPGIHLSFTLLLLCSDSTKLSGASGTSENITTTWKITDISMCAVEKGRGKTCGVVLGIRERSSIVVWADMMGLKVRCQQQRWKDIGGIPQR